MEPSESASSCAFLPEFAYDIFVSYAHFDNDSDRPDVDKNGWVDRFQPRLQTALFKRLGEPVKFWDDRKNLGGSDKIFPAIRSAVDRSALFLILISNRYLKSPSCQAEVAWIQQQVSRSHHSLGSAGRVFPVLLYNIPNRQRPVVCQDMRGFKFYQADGDDLGCPLDPILQDEEFTEVLRKLTSELADLLNHARPPAPPPVAASPLVAPYRAFLTATPGARLRQRERLRETLRGEGIDVLEETLPPPYEVSPHEAALHRILATVDLSVHLIDEQPGPPVVGADRCFPEEQCRLAWDQGGPQLVVLPEFLDLDSLEVPSHRTFLDELQRGVWPGGAVHDGLTVAKARQDDAILDLIRREREKKVRASVARPSGGSRSVFVDLNTRDFASVVPLFEFLEKNNLDPITIPSSGAPPGECRAMFVEMMTRAEAIIIVYGQVGLEWVKSRAQNAYRLIIEKELRFRPIVYAAPPAKPLGGLEFLQCAVVDCTGDFNAGGLASAMKGFTF
jgi:hypothetical protein